MLGAFVRRFRTATSLGPGRPGTVAIVMLAAVSVAAWAVAVVAGATRRRGVGGVGRAREGGAMSRSPVRVPPNAVGVPAQARDDATARPPLPGRDLAYDSEGSPRRGSSQLDWDAEGPHG